MGDRDGARTSVLVEFYTYENPFPWLMDLDYRAVRTERYKLIHWIHYPGEEELYDLAADPFELRNLMAEPGMERVVGDMRALMRREVLAALGLEGS